MGKKLIKLSDFYVLFLFMVLISAFVLYFQFIFGIVSFILTFISFILVLYYIKNKNIEYEEDIRKYKDSLDNIASEVVYKMPFPVAVLNNKGRVKWYKAKILCKVKQWRCKANTILLGLILIRKFQVLILLKF